MIDRRLPLEPAWEKSHWGAPPRDLELLAVPPLSGAVRIAQENHSLLTAATMDVQGKPLAVVRQWARHEIQALAERYLAELQLDVPGAEQSPATESALWFVGGHQPALFHPGVWAKNFALAHLAAQARQQHQAAVSLNLIVDNDTFSSSSISVPVGHREQPRLEAIAFDEPRPMQPWEGAAIKDRSLFCSFADRVTAAIAPWNWQPLVCEFWPAAIGQAKRNGSLVDSLTAGRHSWERSNGIVNLELPLSRVCQSEPFLWFASHLLAELPRLHAIYNQVVHEYRTVNHIRSRMHPVPDLRQDGGWFEAPFWIWKTGETQRNRVLAKQHTPKELWLSTGEEIFARLPLGPGMAACCAVEILKQLPTQGWHLRTRALTTTLFSRLCLADLFVHGLGGAKYDEMTDRIISRFFGISPPKFLLLTATVRVPLEMHPATADDASRVAQQLRELQFNADRHLDPPTHAGAAKLIAEKQALIAESHAAMGQKPDRRPRTSRPSVQRFRRLQELNQQLAAYTGDLRSELSAEMSELKGQLHSNTILGNREYSACLYPAEKVRHLRNTITVECQTE